MCTKRHMPIIRRATFEAAAQQKKAQAPQAAPKPTPAPEPDEPRRANRNPARNQRQQAAQSRGRSSTNRTSADGVTSPAFRRRRRLMAGAGGNALGAAVGKTKLGQ